MTTFYLVRHGETPSNREGRHIGQREEDMTDEGVNQARRMADMLKEVYFDVIYSSPLIRAHDTARILAEINVSGKVPVTDLRLMELHLGIFEGLLPSEAQQSYPAEYKARLEDKLGFTIPNGESYKTLVARLKPFVEELKERYSQGQVCIVAHQGTNRGLLGSLDEKIKKTEIPYLEIPHDEYFKITSTKGVVTERIGRTLRLNLKDNS